MDILLPVIKNHGQTLLSDHIIGIKPNETFGCAMNRFKLEQRIKKRLMKESKIIQNRNYFSIMLRDANVDSKIVVDVLEQEEFGEMGKYEALCIKINEGW